MLSFYIQVFNTELVLVRARTASRVGSMSEQNNFNRNGFLYPPSQWKDTRGIM